MRVLLARLRGLRLTVWRTEFDVVLQYAASDEYPGNYTVTLDNSFLHMNSSGKTESLHQIVQENCGRIDGVPDDAYYTLQALSVNGAVQAPTVPTTANVSEDGRRIIFETVYDLPETDAPMRLRRQCTSLFSTSHPWVSTFYRAVNGFTVTLNHPEDIVPMLYVFGVADDKHPDPDPLPAEVSLPGLHKWTYRGWCLPNQGMVMTFSKGKTPPKLLMAGKDAGAAVPTAATTQAASETNGQAVGAPFERGIGSEL
jgi:hypothetical protein